MTAATSGRGHWAPRLTLGLPAVDAAHRDLLDELARLADMADAEFPESYARFVAQVEKDFREEEDLMEASNFSGLPSHREQHARVLGGLHHVARQVMAQKWLRFLWNSKADKDLRAHFTPANRCFHT